MGHGKRIGAPRLPVRVDFWLYDIRARTLDFTSDAFATAWPHPALVADQYAYWPHGVGHIHSYRARHRDPQDRRHGARQGPASSSPLLLAPRSPTSRTPTTVLTAFGAGEFACPKPVEYDWCANYPALMTPLTWRAPESSLPPWRPSRRPSSDHRCGRAEFKVEERRVGAPPEWMCAPSVFRRA